MILWVDVNLILFCLDFIPVFGIGIPELIPISALYGKMAVPRFSYSLNWVFPI